MQVMDNQSDYVRVTFRFPPELHKQLVKSAKASQNSTNTEAIKRLSSSVSSDMNFDNLSTDDLKSLLALLSEEIRERANIISKISTEIIDN